MTVIDRRTLSLLAALYGVAIVYMAWIPFNFVPIGLAEAWERFVATPWYVQGSDQQADWAANLGMLVPFGFLLAGALRPDPRRGGAGTAVVSFLISVALILVVKFSQLYFPPRTVSLNYILAQSIGSLAGIAAWSAMHRKIAGAVAGIRTAGPRALETILVGYVPLLALVTLQPFNFTFAAADLADRLAALPAQLFELPGFDRSPLHGFALLGVSAVLLAPLGALMELRRPRRYGGIKRALALGIVVSVAMELAQVVIIDGSTRLVSIPVRAPGVVFGMLAFRALRHAQPQRVRRRLRWLAALAAPAYLVALLAFNDLLSTRWQPLNAGLADFDYRYFIPFFGHYFVPKAHAVVSLLTRAVMYMPIGLGLWAWKEAGGPGGARQAAIGTFALAMVLEWARFFKPGLYPDFSNGIIGAISAGMTVVAADYVWRALYTRHVVQVGASAATAPPAAAPRPVAVPVAVEARRPGLMSCIVGLVFLAAAAAVIDLYPIGRIAFALILAAYAVLLWWRPHLWLVIVPAVAPSLSLAPWTGSIYLEESDAVLLVTLGMLCLRMPLRRGIFDFDRWTMFALSLLGLSTAIALAIGAAQLTFANAAIPADYFSPWNAVRVAKGFAAATALLPFLGHSFRSRDDAFRLFASGMVVGLTLVGLAVLLERALFPGVFDFASDYRVAGPFASMHVGGAHLPAYLALALPFTAVIVVVPRRRALIGAMTLGALCLGVYALIVTFNRTAYAAAGLTLVTLFVGLFYAVRADPRWRRITAAVAVTVGSAAAAAVGIALLSPIMRERFATTEADTAVRLDDWRAGLALRDRSWATSILGMGLGSFPRNYLFAAGDNERPATFSLRTRDGQSFLRLGAGTASYLGQKIDVGPDLTYDLKVTLRANDDKAALLVLLCEKYLIYSVNCVEKSLQPAARSAWAETGAQLDSGEIGQPPIAALPWLRRPAELVLVNATPGTIVEIARVQLLDPNARDVVANGDFSAGLSRWLFTNDNYFAWRISSMWVMTLFEQGWFGLLALVALLGTTFRHLIGAMRVGDRAAPIIFAALTGFCAMGLTDGLIEVPRLAALFYLVMFVGLCLRRGARADARATRPQTAVSVRPTPPDRPVPTRHPPSKTAVRP